MRLELISASGCRILGSSGRKCLALVLIADCNVFAAGSGAQALLDALALILSHIFFATSRQGPVPVWVRSQAVYAPRRHGPKPHRPRPAGYEDGDMWAAGDGAV